MLQLKLMLQLISLSGLGSLASAVGANMPERDREELSRQLLQYQALQREVNDPLAAALLNEIVLEVEQDLDSAQAVEPPALRAQSS